MFKSTNCSIIIVSIKYSRHLLDDQNSVHFLMLSSRVVSLSITVNCISLMRINAMDSALFLLVFVSHITLCDSQTYAGRKFELKATVPLPFNDFKPLFTVDDSKARFHQCFFLCERNQQCIGVEICKVKENLFRCQACCEWKKEKKYTTQSGASNCTYYEQVSIVLLTWLHFQEYIFNISIEDDELFSSC